MPHMIYLKSLNKIFFKFPLPNITSFSSQRITRFWIVDENIPRLIFPKKGVSRNGLGKGSFLRWNLQDKVIKVTTHFLAVTLSKNVDTVVYCSFSVLIMYKNFLINYHKITKVIIVKILYNEMNLLINCKTNIDKW